MVLLAGPTCHGRPDRVLATMRMMGCLLYLQQLMSNNAHVEQCPVHHHSHHHFTQLQILLT